ncbi:hypothetical protein F2P81_022196 [Scophthalmus maximus]|uniref:Uncharacterized protein n=1 Tax=Scophthalmus maximus TaxID=52904 RepID=A0A6A4RZ72_SCOMX|nr:hypothetical protein F2P81_022196 [Scophthalmus maximus]
MQLDRTRYKNQSLEEEIAKKLAHTTRVRKHPSEPATAASETHLMTESEMKLAVFTSNIMTQTLASSHCHAPYCDHTSDTTAHSGIKCTSCRIVLSWMHFVIRIWTFGGEPCLIISEINADNPRLDTTEFVELYHTSGQRASLDGYTLVFYNGNGNIAYKVLDLKGHSTDDRGFFLVGSVDMLPKPAILLPPNTVQNGPDAIVLYHTSAARYGEKMNVTAVGLVDAVVYMTRRTGGAEFLAETLTPGEPAFVEDETALEGDESIERCLLSEDRWGFQVSSPSPGQRNNCTPPAAPVTSPVITELKLGGGQVDGFVELTDAPAAGPLVLVVLDGKTDRVSVSVDVNVETSRNMLTSVTIEKNYMKVIPGGTDSPAHFPPWGNSDFLINELNTDTPGAAEDGEYIELWHTSGRRVSLQGIWILLFSANSNKPYREISLSGHFTTSKGYFLLGSDRLVPAPSLRLPPNTIQNGPDAVALYRSPFGPPSATQRGIPTKGLLDAVVYRRRGSDKEAQELSKALTPGQLPLLEDPEVLPGDESLSRCRGLYPHDLSAFSVAPPTPLRENTCPRPPPAPEGVVISEVASGHWTNHSQQRAFVELHGPPMTDLRGLVLSVFDQERSGTVIALPLTGSIDQDGFYIVGNVTGADQIFPEGSTVPVRGAVVLCYDLFSVCRAGTALTNSSLRDALVFSENQQLLSSLTTTRGRQVIPALRSVEDGTVSLSRCSCCEVRSPSSWTSSSPTPHGANLCPSNAFSSQIDLCLGPLSSDWHDQSGDCSGLIQGKGVAEVANYLEKRCHCGISALYLQGANFSCVSGWLRVWGNIQALSDHQKALIVQTSHMNPSPVQGDVCSSPTTDRYTSTDTNRNTFGNKLLDLLMERKAHYDSILDRSKRITWQDDCYMDLQSTSCSLSLQPETEDVGWIQKHQDQLRRFTTTSFLEGMLTHLRKMDVLSLAEESKIMGAGRLQDQLNMLTTIVTSTDTQGSDTLQGFIESSDSQVAQLIINHDCMVKEHKEVLLRRYEQHKDRDSVSCLKLNTSSRTLLLVDGLSDLQQKEHDLMQVGVTRGRKRNHLRQLALAKLLEPLTRVSLPPRVSLTVGVAGIGKTTCVRHFIRQWSQGAIYTDVSFILPFTFCELNSLEKLSAEKLVKIAFPHLTDPSLVLSSSCRTLLILDGLDDFRCTLNFSDAAPCNDPKKDVSIEDLVTNIIRGNLLPDVAVWVTSRPRVASLIPGGLVDRVTEIPGFSPKDIQVFLNHHFSERDFASKIWEHLESYKIIMVMCYIPSICWIVANTLMYIMQSGTQESLPRTCTELYAHFCSMKAEVGEPRGREHVKMEQLHGSNRKLLGNLGRLAFYGLLKHKYSFSEQDLRAYGIDLQLTQSSFGAGVLVREESTIYITYRFTHLTLQEFLAATFYHVSSKRAIFDLFSESTMSWPKIGFQNHFRSAFQRAQQAEDGHLDVFVRFLTGLLCPVTLKPLAGLLSLGRDDGSQKAWAAGFLQGLLVSGGVVVSLRTVNLAYCLQELQHTELLRSVEEDLRLGSLAGKLTLAHCVVLGYLLHVSPECSEQTNLTGSLNYTTVKCLLPQLLYCSHLRLENNHFKDDIMELLGSLLSAKDCHIQKISLAENSISNKGAKALSRALLVNRTLTSLNLRNNNIGSKGARFLAEALKMNQVLVSINFQNNAIEEEGARALAEVLQCNRKLVSLNLCSNQLGDKGTIALAEALTLNHTLLSLQLQSNSISNRGMAALTKALRLNRGLVSLNLRENSIGVDGAKNMAHALHENNSLQDLDLTANLLHDEGVQALAGAIRLNQGLTSLHLQWNFIKSTATKALAHALLSNGTMQLLDLQENAIGNEGVIFLAEALKTNASLRTLCIQGVSAGKSGAIALAEALMTNKTLQTLDLRGNTVGMDGAKALANALKSNRSLKSLNLQGNGIGESGAKVISDAIRANAPSCVVDI